MTAIVIIAIAIAFAIALPAKEDSSAALQWRAVEEMEARGEYTTAAEIREHLLRRQHG